MAVADIQAQMAKNSAAYATADPATQAILHQNNLDLAKQIGSTYNSGAGTYTASADPAQSLASSQKSAQDFINSANSGQGGTDAYIKGQDAKLATATANNDTAMLAKLQADSQRTGLTYSNTPAQTPTTPVTPPSTPTTPGQPTTNNNSSGNAQLIQDQYNQNYASQLQKLQDARNQALTGLAGQDTLINQNKMSDLNNNDVMATKGLSALKEAMANQGVGGGDSITAQIGNQTSQQQGANGINQNASNQLQQLQAQKDQINNSSNADDLALMQQLQATRSGQLIDNNNTQDQRAIQLAQLMGTYNGQQTLGGQQQALAAQNQGFNQNLATTQQNQSQQNQDFNQTQQTNAVAYQTARDAIGDKEYQQTFDNNVKQQGLAYALQKATLANQITNDQAQRAISQQNANSSTANSNANISNMNADNTRQDNAVKLTADQNTFAGTIQNELGQATSRDDVVKFFNANGGEITNKLGADAFNKMKTQALAQYDGVSKSDAQSLTIREKAIAAAQKDSRLLSGSSKLSDLIPEYEALYK